MGRKIPRTGISGDRGPGVACCTGELCHWLPGEKIDDVIRWAAMSCLEYHGWNRVHTARALGISLRTMRLWIKKWRADGYDVED